MPKLDLTRARQIKGPMGEILSLKGPGYSWVRPPQLSDFYGIAPGQIPLHLAPEDAVMDARGVVQSVPNKGGAGAAFNATASAQGITVTAGRFSLPTPGPYLQLANAADLVGVRVFFVGRSVEGISYDPRFAGSFGHNTHLRISRANGRAVVNRGSESFTLGGHSINASAALNIYEIEIVNGRARIFLNGVLSGIPVTIEWPDFLADRIFTGQSHPFAGEAGDICSMVTDGSAAMDLRAAEIRTILAAKHGIALT